MICFNAIFIDRVDGFYILYGNGTYDGDIFFHLWSSDENSRSPPSLHAVGNGGIFTPKSKDSSPGKGHIGKLTHRSFLKYADVVNGQRSHQNPIGIK